MEFFDRFCSKFTCSHVLSSDENRKEKFLKMKLLVRIELVK